MSIVVQQTVPFPFSILDLENPQRWSTLFPLIRPSVVPIQTVRDQVILVDTSLSKSEHLHIAVVGRPGNTSSKLLDDAHVTAIATQQQAAEPLTAKDISNAIELAGLLVSHGLVIVRTSSRQAIKVSESKIIEVETQDQLEFDHLLYLLGSASESCRSSFQHTAELVEIFQKNVSATRSRFATQKAEGSPAILHVDGLKRFEKARPAIEKDLNHVIGAQTAAKDSVFSVHYSDLNGLSRLENYIIAGEIGQLLEAQHLSYKLSHSTIHDHKQLDRGYAISICAIPPHLLTAQPLAEAHQQIQHAERFDPELQVRPSAVMSFSDAQVRARIVAGCEAVIQAEPEITEYDTVVGDGDCGYTLRDGAKQILSFINGKDLTRLHVVVEELVGDLEVNMGGTSGALYCIYLTALAAALGTESSIPKALKVALDELLKYTRARVGDRTMMDTLIPYIDTLDATNDPAEAVQKAREGMHGTRTMEATLGRSSYLDESTTQGVPDPGAYGLLVLLEAMSNAS